MARPWRQLVADVLAGYTWSTFTAGQIVRRLKSTGDYGLAMSLHAGGDESGAKKVLEYAIEQMGYEPQR